jgi:hypothetical protein
LQRLGAWWLGPMPQIPLPIRVPVPVRGREGTFRRVAGTAAFAETWRAAGLVTFRMRGSAVKLLGGCATFEG